MLETKKQKIFIDIFATEEIKEEKQKTVNGTSSYKIYDISYKKNEGKAFSLGGEVESYRLGIKRNEGKDKNVIGREIDRTLMVVGKFDEATREALRMLVAELEEIGDVNNVLNTGKNFSNKTQKILEQKINYLESGNLQAQKSVKTLETAGYVFEALTYLKYLQNKEVDKNSRRFLTIKKVEGEELKETREFPVVSLIAYNEEDISEKNDDDEGFENVVKSTLLFKVYEEHTTVVVQNVAENNCYNTGYHYNKN